MRRKFDLAAGRASASAGTGPVITSTRDCLRPRHRLGAARRSACCLVQVRYPHRHTLDPILRQRRVLVPP